MIYYYYYYLNSDLRNNKIQNLPEGFELTNIKDE